MTPAGSPVAENCTAWSVAMADCGGVSEMAMALAVPLTWMTWGESEALSVRVMVSERWPGAVGMKVTVMVQVPMEATGPLQVFVEVKSPGLLPPATMEEMTRAAVPELVMVTGMGALEAPRAVAGKATGLGEMVTEGKGFGL